MSKKLEDIKKYKRFFINTKNLINKLLLHLGTVTKESTKKDNNTLHKKYLKKKYPKKYLVDINLILLFFILFLSQVIITKKIRYSRIKL